MLKLLVGVEYHNMLLVRLAVVPYIVYKYLYLQRKGYKYLYEQGGEGQISWKRNFVNFLVIYDDFN